MPRRSRHFIPGIPLHIIQRGNNRQACFFRERDYIIYLDKLREYSLAFGTAVHSYVLMTNHVHLLLTPTEKDSASRLLQALGRYYVRYINATYGRTGTLWEGRFKASLVHSGQYLLTVYRYIEMNPVRAGMVDHPAGYPWSSYQSNALGKTIKLVTPHAVYNALGKDRISQQAAYQCLFNSQLPEWTLEEIRQAANKGWVLGDSKFKKQVEQQLGYELPPFKRGGDRKSAEARRNRIKLL